MEWTHTSETARVDYCIMFIDSDNQESKYYCQSLYDATALACIFDKASMNYQVIGLDGKLTLSQGMFGKKLVKV